MSPRVISPPLSDLPSLPTPLTPGERRVLEVLDRILPEGWEIYVQPHMNGLRPDFVLLHPENGMAAIEVKDLEFGAMSYSFDNNTSRLVAKRGNKSFRVPNPFSQVKRYEEGIHDLYCPSLLDRNGQKAISTIVFFTEASRTRLKELFGENGGYSTRSDRHVTASKEDLESEDLAIIFPRSTTKCGWMTPTAAKELRSWLVEPDVSAEQRQPLPLDSRQEEIATTRTATGYRRIKGPAGSGKSLVLAARAAELAKAGVDVLVVTFNITLLNYLRDLAVRRHRPSVNRITWLNFHAWCKQVCEEAEETKRYSELFRNRKDYSGILAHDLTALVQKVIGEDTSHWITRYDAILVDEGQDFRLEWWAALRRVLKPRGEMLLVADPTQDVYETARAWTENAMAGAGFRGEWMALTRCYRMPSQLVPHVRRFAETFLPADELRTLPDDTQLDLPWSGRNPVHLRWVQAEQEKAVDACVGEILSLPARTDGAPIPWADITFLTGSTNVGEQVVRSLQKRGIRAVHTFAKEGEDDRRLKLRFYKGAPLVKATTIHSFKGWESRALVVHLGYTHPDQMAVAYTALTRLKHHDQQCTLTVVSTSADMAAYGRTWPEARAWGADLHRSEFPELADFPAQWLGLMKAFERIEDVEVTPGGDIPVDGRVVGTLLATIRSGNAVIKLIDNTREREAVNVEKALTRDGHLIIRARPDEVDLYKRIRDALGGEPSLNSTR